VVKICGSGEPFVFWTFNSVSNKMDLQKVGGGRGDWMELAQDRDRCAGTCRYGEGLLGSINAGNFKTSCKVNWLGSQEGLCSME